MRVLVLAALLVAGCPTTYNMRAARSDESAGVAKEYEGSCRSHYLIAKRAVRGLRLDILSSDAENGELLVRRGRRATVGGEAERVAIWFDAVGGRCRIRVYGHAAPGSFTTQADWPLEIFRRMKLVRDAVETETEED